MLQDGEIDHRQRAGENSDSLHMNVKKYRTTGESLIMRHLLVQKVMWNGVGIAHV